MRVSTIQFSHPLPRFNFPVTIFSDEYADVKAVKLLRRGRLLLQVEYVIHHSHYD